MLIAYYRSPSNFPGWPSPRLHQGVFNRFDRNNKEITFIKQDGGKRVSCMDESWFWPALVGLDRIRWPVLAHFSFFRGKVGPGGHYYPPRVWIQITTHPFQDVRGMNVEILWQLDVSEGDASQKLAYGNVDPSVHTVPFWAEFFTQKLMAKRAFTETALNEAKREVERFNRILSSIPRA